MSWGTHDDGDGVAKEALGGLVVRLMFGVGAAAVADVA